MSNLISIQKATVKKFDQVIFEDLEFQWNQGEHWAILGETGSEMTAFLDTILGKTMVTSGIIERPFSKEYQNQKNQFGEINSFRDLVATVSQHYGFKNKSNLQNFYYQQRFNSMESEEAFNVEEYLKSIDVKIPGPWSLSKVIAFMKLGDLREKSLIKLSNGESRRLAIATALIQNPKLLLMDQPLTGLDLETNEDFSRILSEITASGIHVLMSAHDSQLPKGITHIGLIENRRIKKVLLTDLVQFNSQKLEPKNVLNLESFGRLLEPLKIEQFKKVIELKDVTIKYGNNLILDKVNWTILPNEKWALKGENGAGKSTLLSLILGENPQAYANEIWLFDFKRGSGESIWDIKKQIGFVAPELSRYFPSNQTCIKVVLSGLFDTMGLFKKVTPEQEKIAMDWLALFALENVAKQSFKQVSLENQRFILLARALIKKPTLLVLDEAAQGMDELMRVRFRKTVDMLCSIRPLTMIYVSHYETDFPESVDKNLRLKKGKVVG